MLKPSKPRCHENCAPGRLGHYGSHIARIDGSNPAMKRSARERGMYLVSLGMTAVPFAFALIRAAQTGSDRRYLWLAVASFLGARGMMAFGKRCGRKSIELLALSAAALTVATLLAGSAAYLLGATSAAGIWIVALGFGLCSAAGCALDALSRPVTN
jgi:hypothetical protein